MPFSCNICEEVSTRICVACTKDACENHLCEKCSRCSDCCGCEVSLNEREPAVAGAAAAEAPFLMDEQELGVAEAPVEEGPAEPPAPNFGAMGEA